MDEDKKTIALFRYQVIAPLLALEGERGELKRALERLAEKSHDHPRHGSIHLGKGTIEEWLYTFKKGSPDSDCNTYSGEGPGVKHADNDCTKPGSDADCNQLAKFWGERHNDGNAGTH